MATNGVKYNKPARELGKRELHRLLISEGLTFNQLHERTGIPKRTLSRWLSQMYKEDNALLITPTKEQVALATSIYKERLQHMYQSFRGSGISLYG